MITFPNIAPPKTPEVTAEDPGLTTKTESGMVLSRARFTKSRLTFVLRWGPDKNLLPTEDKEILLDFYRNTVKGSSEMFEWTCNSKFSPYHGETFTVRIIQPPRFQMVAPGYWQTELVLQEA